MAVDSSGVVDRAIDLVRQARDVLLIGLGVIVMVALPPSLREFGLSPAVAHVWASLILGGAAAALAASYRRQWIVVEIWGCLAVVAGLAIWAAGLMAKGTSASWAVAIVVVCAILGEVVRIADTIGEREATR